MNNYTWIIYKHTLIADGPYRGWSYIGQTCTSLERRFKNGKGYLGRKADGSYQQPIFAPIIEKYGWENFSHEILEQNIKSLDLANKREKYWISHYHTWYKDPECRGFNYTPGGGSSGTLGKIKIYKASTEEFIFINEVDLFEYELLGWERWFTPERKQALRKKYYEDHKQHELELNKKNALARRATRKDPTAKPKQKQNIKINLNIVDFASYADYLAAYKKEYNRQYREQNKTIISEKRKEHRQKNQDTINAYYRDYYATHNRKEKKKKRYYKNHGDIHND